LPHTQLQDVTINVFSQGDSLEAVFNPLDLQRVLQNLIIDAGYVTEAGGQIDVGLSRNDDNLQVSETDEGCGIPEEV